ncbi:MAG: alpha-amylase family glycosyl hydrolase [Actinomycetota bacterium]|nr:alpha-amylase family glycosyl hydrolase [Actinomycetota bacterium]
MSPSTGTARTARAGGEQVTGSQPMGRSQEEVPVHVEPRDEKRAARQGPQWWRYGVLYQVYVRSFSDANGDGIGDLRGVVERLDHLEDLGVDGIWLSPVTESPDIDWGYDVSDYLHVHPELGTMGDLDELVAQAGARGIRVLLDLVPNHTSDQHPWFVESRSSRDAPRRDWYVWADPGTDGSPPNNWVSSFGGPAWTLDEPTGQYYLHNHLAEQPDLNWWNDGVRDSFDSILRFWLDRGVAGFRIDVCNMIVKDALLRDNPAATPDDDAEAQLFGQRPVFNANRPEVHDVLRRWRQIADAYDAPRVLLGETPVDVGSLARYYGNGSDELHLAFNFPFITSPLSADALRQVVEATETWLPVDACPVWTGSNHDMSRLATRWAQDDPRRVRAALMMLLCLRGTIVLYQGDEIGLGNTPVGREDLRDPLGVRYWPYYEGRDAMRTPMPWNPGPGGGFTTASTPWLPIGDVDACNVEGQREDPSSTLSLVRDLIALRHREPDLATGAYVSRDAPLAVWAWQRGARHVVVVNFADTSATWTLAESRIVIGTDRGRDGEPVSGEVELAGWEGLVVELAAPQ